MACVKETDGFHVIITQREVEKVDVLLHSLHMSGLWDDDDTILDKKLQGYLGRCLSVFLTDGNVNRSTTILPELS